MRVLHVLDAGVVRLSAGAIVTSGEADEAAALLGAVLSRSNRAEHACLLLGPAPFSLRARRLGLHADRAICPALSRPALAWRGIQRLARAHRPEVVVAWSAASERAATLSLGRAMPAVRVDLAGGAGATGPAARRARVDVQALAAPPLPPPPSTIERAALRARFGLRESDTAVLLLGLARDANATRFAFTLGLSMHTGHAVVGLLPAWSDSLARAMRYQAKLVHKVRLVVFPDLFAEVLTAADAAIWVGGGRSSTWPAEGRPPRTQVARCLAAGVPVVAPAGCGVDDLYSPEAREVCLAETPMPPEIARRLIPLVEDRALRERIAASCAAERAGKDGLDDFAAALEAACEQAAGSGGWAEVVAQQFARAPGAP